MSTTPPTPPPGTPPGGEEPPEGPASAVGGGTHSPSDTMTRYDAEKDAYHCSYGIPAPALAVLDPERELIVRVDRHSFQVDRLLDPQFHRVAQEARRRGGQLRGRPAGRLAEGPDRHERVHHVLVAGAGDAPPAQRRTTRAGPLAGTVTRNRAGDVGDPGPRGARRRRGRSAAA